MRYVTDRIGLLTWLLMTLYLIVGVILGTVGTMLWDKHINKPIPVSESKNIVITNVPNKVYKMRITAYHNKGDKKSALNERVQAGRTAAVSPACIDLLGEKVYVEGHGIRHVNDLAAKWLDDKFGVCTLDLAISSSNDTHKYHGHIKTVVKLNN